jgi:hypothetical protein
MRAPRRPWQTPSLLPLAASVALACLAVLVCGGCGEAPARPVVAPPAAVADGSTGAAAPSVPPPATGRPREITFDDIKLDMQKGDPFTRDLLPARVTALERHAVRIRGYILPSFQQTGLTQFVLVRDNQECCFGPGAALHDCVVVRMRPGRTANFSIRPVAVAGTFRVEELRGPDGKHLAIYALDGDAVE